MERTLGRKLTRPRSARLRPFPAGLGLALQWAWVVLGAVLVIADAGGPHSAGSLPSAAGGLCLLLLATYALLLTYARLRHLLLYLMLSLVGGAVAAVLCITVLISPVLGPAHHVSGVLGFGGLGFVAAVLALADLPSRHRSRTG